MNHRVKHILIAAIVLVTASIAHADLITYTYDMSSTTANTLESLGRKFVIGCTVLALGIVAATVISRKK
jgi:hypothetical protein